MRCKMAKVRAIEIGFGTTSFTQSVDASGIPVINTYPSVVAKSSSKQGMDAGMHKRDSVVVDIDGEHFEVGKDAILATDTRTSRVLNNEYITSAQYKALLFGSLLMMNEPVIELLVLSLPVSNWQKRTALKELALGEHIINGQTFKVNDVFVMVQPIAGIISYANRRGQEFFNSIQDENILCVDPGFGTFDWIVSRGLKLNENRSGAVDLGMSAVLKNVADKLKQSFPEYNEIPLDQIDYAFYKNEGFIKLAGKKYPFPICNGECKDGNKVPVVFDLSNTIEQVTNSAVTELINVVGSKVDIDRVVLMGGPHAVYKASLASAFSTHSLDIIRSPLTAICEGMYIAGVQRYRALHK